MKGVKSKLFASYWKTFFYTAMCYPDKITTSVADSQKVKHYKAYYDSIQYILPCVFCRDFTRDVLMKEFPLDFSGRIPLMKSIWVWKDRVNKKLGSRKSPKFETILKRYDSCRATCDKSVGKCI